MKRRLFLLFVFFLLLVLGIAGVQKVQAKLQRPEVRQFAQTWASRVLRTDVTIGKLRYLPPAGISLEELQIASSKDPRAPSFASVPRLVLTYGLVNLIRGDFRIPETVKIESPEIRFSTSPRSPVSLFDSVLPGSDVLPTKLVIQGGEFRYPWGEDNQLVLSKVSFNASPSATGQFRVKLKAMAEGVADGKIEVSGVTDARFQHYQFDVRFQGLVFSPEVQIPVHEHSGNLRVSEKLIEILGVSSLVHDWDVQWHGRIEDWQTKPKVVVEVTRKKTTPPFLFSMQMDLASQKLEGRAEWTGHSYPFRGNIWREGKRLVLPRLEIPNGYAGKGNVDIANGDYDFWFERGERRFHLRSNLNRLEFDTELQLDHASINHLDWVVLGKARFIPLPRERGKPGPRFKAQVQTDYVIVEYQPLQDFRGSFEVSPEGIQGLNLEWSGVFHLEGRILFRGGESREDLALHVEGYPLESIREFARRPLPTNLKGTLEGKLKLRGEFSRPEIQGHFTIKDGMIGKLDFDRAVIEFGGFPPQLRLYDSKVFRGRNVLKMTGVIDLRLENLFHGIQIQRPDHFVLWKGMNVYWKEGQSAIEADKPLGKRLSMDFEVGNGTPDSKSNDSGEERHAVAGPKLKF